MFNICQRFAAEGMAGLAAKPRGPEPAQKPLRRAYEQSAEAVQRWVRQDYPAILARARRAKGTI